MKAMNITLENIKEIGFVKHNLFNKHSGIYKFNLKDSFEVRILFETKTVKSNDENFDCKVLIDNVWINHKIIETNKYRIVLFVGDEFNRGYEMPLSLKTKESLSEFINTFN